MKELLEASPHLTDLVTQKSERKSVLTVLMGNVRPGVLTALVTQTAGQTHTASGALPRRAPDPGSGRWRGAGAGRCVRRAAGRGLPRRLLIAKVKELVATKY